MIHVQLKVVSKSDFNMSIGESLGGIERTVLSGMFIPWTPMNISPSKRNLGTTWGKENSFLPRPRTYARSPSWICCCSTDYTVNPAFSESWVICVVDCVEGRLCHCTYLIIYYLPYTLLALCSKMINRQLSLSRVKIHRVLQNSIKPQSGIMQDCLQLRYNLDYTRNRRRDLTMQCLFIHSWNLNNTTVTLK